VAKEEVYQAVLDHINKEDEDGDDMPELEN